MRQNGFCCVLIQVQRAEYLFPVCSLRKYFSKGRLGLQSLLTIIEKLPWPFDAKFGLKADCQTFCCSFFGIIFYSFSIDLTCEVPIWIVPFPNEQRFEFSKHNNYNKYVECFVLQDKSFSMSHHPWQKIIKNKLFSIIYTTFSFRRTRN